MTMTNAWRIVGDNKPKEVIAFNKIPIKRLLFVEYKVGDKFYRAVQPAATYWHFTKLGISAKERKAKLALTPEEKRIDSETGGKTKKIWRTNNQWQPSIINDSFQYRSLKRFHLYYMRKLLTQKPKYFMLSAWNMIQWSRKYDHTWKCANTKV